MPDKLQWRVCHQKFNPNFQFRDHFMSENCREKNSAKKISQKRCTLGYSKASYRNDLLFLSTLIPQFWPRILSPVHTSSAHAANAPASNSRLETSMKFCKMEHRFRQSRATSWRFTSERESRERKKDGRQIVREEGNSGKPERLIEKWSRKKTRRREGRAHRQKEKGHGIKSVGKAIVKRTR